MSIWPLRPDGLLTFLARLKHLTNRRAPTAPDQICAAARLRGAKRYLARDTSILSKEADAIRLAAGRVIVYGADRKTEQ